MNVTGGRRLLPAAIACLMLVGVFTPVVLQGQVAQIGPSQLSVLIGAAESSKLYAHSTVDYAVSHRLAVAGAQAQLNQADSLLATAKEDAQAGNNFAAGIQAAEAAMSAYTGASKEASIALNSAGLTASADYYAAEDAILEINATASAVLSVEVQACANAGADLLKVAAFTQACSQVTAQATNARAHINQAASLWVQANGHTNANLDLTQVFSLISTAREEVASCQSALVTIASYSYSARGRAFVASVIVPLSGQANATIKAEQTILANLTQLQITYVAYDQSQASAAASVTASASIVGSAISRVQADTTTLATSASGVYVIAGQVQRNFTSLSSLIAPFTSVTAIASLQASIQMAESSTTAYSNKAATAESDIIAFPTANVGDIPPSFISVIQTDQTNVSTAATTYASAYASVQSQLATVILLNVVPGLTPWQTTLATLGQSVTSTTVDLSTALQSEVSDITMLQTDASSLASVVTTSSSAILVSTSLVSTAGTVSAGGKGYLNASTAAALGKVSTTVQATVITAQSFVASANAYLQSSIAAYASSAMALSNSAVALKVQSQDTVAVLATAASYVNSDTHGRIAEAAAGQADVSQALRFYSGLNVSAGTMALAQSYLEFQTASTVSA